MLYSEFVEGTGCRENEHNYNVYKNLEIMYMNSDMTKEEIYAYGRKLVDNSKSEAQLKLEAEVKAEIEAHKAEIERYKGYIEQDEYMAELAKEQNAKERERFYKNSIKFSKGEIKSHKAQIAMLKQVLA